MRKRTIKKNIWLNYAEDRQLKYLSKSLGLSEANVIRRLLYEINVKAPPPKEFYDAIEKINRIGVNINQLTRIANTTNTIYVYELNKQMRKLDELVDNLRESYL